MNNATDGRRPQGFNREIMRLALPSILANITVPLVGMVDIAIAGHISDASAIGGIAIGAMLFDLLYWNFGFLRVGTGGLTAQAFGRGDMKGAVEALRQSLTVSLGAALAIWAIQWLFLTVVMALVPCSPEVGAFARRYFYIRIWAAPATLSLMAFKGWFIGMQNTVAPMACDIVVNVVNMAASFGLAVWTPLGAVGVAWGTLVAQYTGLLTAVVCLLRVRRRHGLSFSVKDYLRHPFAVHLGRDYFRLNGNLFVRSLCFMVVYVGFTSLTSKYGDGPLAVSSIMMKLFMLFSYFIDGFAYAGEALTGRFIGEGNRVKLSSSVRILLAWSVTIGVVFTVLYAVAGEGFVRLMTSDAAVIEGARPFLPWLVAMPLVSCLAFMWDGIFVGATAGKQVRNCMIWAAVGFVLCCLLLSPSLGIHAIYAGYFAHLVARALYLTIVWPKTRATALND